MGSLHIVLVEPEIHWNTGNVGRTTLALGADLHLVEPLGFSLAEPQLRRAGLDYWPRVRLKVWPAWTGFEKQIARLGTPYFFTAAATKTLWDVKFPRDVVLIFGRESVGLPSELLARHRDHCLRVPMQDPELRSLNLSTCAAVAGAEVVRQWRETHAKVGQPPPTGYDPFPTA